MTLHWASPKASVFDKWRSKQARRCCSIPMASSNAEPSPSTRASIGCEKYSATVRPRRTALCDYLLRTMPEAAGFDDDVAVVAVSLV